MRDRKIYIAGGILAASAVAAGYFAKKNRNSSTQLGTADASTDEQNESERVQVPTETGDRSNIIGIEPATPFETVAFLGSLTPSLMTRDSKNQGAATAASVLSAKGVSNIVEILTNGLLGKDTSYANKLFTRSVVAGGGYALSRIPEKKDESLVVSSIRSGGQLLEVASLSGMVYDSISKVSAAKKKRYKAIPLGIGAVLAAGLLYRGKTMLEDRRSMINTVPEDPSNKILPSAAASVAVLQVAKLIGRAIGSTNRGLESWLGEGPLKKNVALIANTTLWTSLAVGAYWAGVSKIGTANEKFEKGYDTPPSNQNVSGSPKSICSFDELGLQGRRFVTDVVTPAQIKRVTGKKAKKAPIRVYVGFNSDRHYHSARAEMAIAELRRTKAFDRKYLLLISPTGTGWIDQTMIEAAEIMTGGDIATCVVQYAKYPSFLALQKVVSGRRQFRQLLWSVKMQMSERPVSRRPKIIVFGESLGAWSSSDTVMHTGIDGFDHYGIDRALWVGMPGLSKWGKIEHGETMLDIPEGTVEVFDRPEQFEKLSKKQRDKLRAVVLNHDNDPIAQLRPKLIVKRPEWLRNGKRGRGIPEKMEWSPLSTFIQIAIDAGNAMRVIPGEFRSHGHDYRADMAYFVNAAYQLGADKKMIKKVVDFQIKQELLRTSRVNGDGEDSLQ